MMTSIVITSNSEIRRARIRFLWVGLVLPLALCLAALLTVAIWFPRLPDPVAMHWGRGEADGFGPRWTILIPPLIVIAIVLLLGVGALVAHRLPGAGTSANRGGAVVDREGTPRWSVTGRFLGATNLGLAGLLSIMAVSSAGLQLDLGDARQTPDIGPWVLFGSGIAVVLVAAGWFVQPRITPDQAGPKPAMPAVLAAEERVAWIGTVTIGRTGAWGLGSLMLGTFALAVALVGTGEPMMWLILLVVITVSLVAAMTLVFHVRVSSAGLSVRSSVGWPRVRIPVDDVEAVGVVSVTPIADFGGWGWRFGVDGRIGIVLRAGDALEVQRRSGRTVVVTVDGAAQAASVLAAVVERHRNEAAESPRGVDGGSE